MADHLDEAALERYSDDLAQQPEPVPKEYGRDYHVRQAVPSKTTPQLVSTNHFRIGSNPPFTRVIEYELIMDVSRPPNKRKTKAIYAAAIRELEPFKSHVKDFATNGMSTVISWVDLHPVTAAAGAHPTTVSKALTVPDTSPGTTWDIGSVSSGDKSIPMKLKLVRYLNWDDFRNFAAADAGLKDLNVNNLVRAYNILVSHCFTDSQSEEEGTIVKIGSNKFFREETRKPLGYGFNRCLELMRGYFYSLKPGNGAILLNVNAGCSAFYRETTVDEFLRDTATFKGSGGYAALVGVQVEIVFGKANEAAREATARPLEDRIRTIQSWSAEPLEKLSFIHDEDGKLKVTDYLQSQYGLITNDKTLFAINVGTRFHKAWYAPEHLRIVKNQVYRKPVPELLTKHMVETACIPPTETRSFTQEAVKAFLDMGRCPALAIILAMHEVSATWLSYPLVRYRGDDYVDLNDTKSIAEGKVRWDLRGKSFQFTKGSSFQLKYYLIVCSGLERKETSVAGYERSFKEMATLYELGKATAVSPIGGDTLTWPPVKENKDEDGAGNENQNDAPMPTLEEEMDKKLYAAKRAGAELVIFVQQGKTRETYSVLKSLSDRKHGLQSLCLTEQANKNKDFTSKDLAQYMGNIMMKTNLKFGGVNHNAIVRTNGSQRITATQEMNGILILGADVTHPSPGSVDYCPSIASVVGSVQNGPGRFLGSMRLQQGKKEIIQGMVAMAAERIRDWAKGNRNKLPEQILYYRDGVDEGQYGKVKHEEVPKIREALAQVAKERGKTPGEAEELKNNLKITAIVVAKRHHTRFFANNKGQMQFPDGDARTKNENTRPGLLVDSGVTSPYFYNYYFQAHSGLKGTVKPTHYFFLQHEVNLSEQQIVRLTQAFCYTYVRATIGVSYASPAYYADRLCERGRCYLRDLFIGASDYTKELEQYGKDLEEVYENIRDKKYPKPPKPKGKKKAGGKREKRPEKSDEELKLVDQHKKAIVEKLKARTMEWAEREFYRYKKEGEEEGNPWADDVTETMFWM